MSELSYIIPLAILVAFAALLYGLVTYAMKRNDDIAKKKAKEFMWGGGLGLIALIIVWGFVGYSQSSLGLSGSTNLSIPSGEGYSKSLSYGAPMIADEVAYRGAESEQESISPMPPVPGGDSGAPAGNSKIIKNASLSLLVDDIDDAVAGIGQIRNTVGGQSGNASFRDYLSSRTGNITIWVPSERFDEALASIRKLALQVESENVSVSDVSAQFVDLEARLLVQKATEAQYTELLKRAGKLSDVLEVSRELANTRTQIEQLQGQMNYLSRQVALSSISVSLTQEVSPGEVKNEWRPLTVVKGAAKQTLKDLTGFIDMLLVMAVMLPMFLLRVAFWILVAWVVWRGGRFIFAKFKDTGLPHGTL